MTVTPNVATPTTLDAFNADAARRNWPRCPSLIIEALQAYVDGRVPTGSFTMAVLQNNLTMAVMRADDDSLLALRDIVGVVYDYVPEICWGSPDKVRSWLKKDRA